MARKKISRAKFLQAREYILRDIRRELELARVSDTPASAKTLVRLGVTPGGGNFIAALAMLCYTEFSGGIATGRSGCRYNFDAFLRRMGSGYGELLDSGLNPYSLFRCGMAHEYFAKGSMTVSMFGDAPTGLGKHDGRLFFILEKYFADFCAAFDDLGRELGYL